MSGMVEVWLDDALLGPPTRIGSLARGHERNPELTRFAYAPAWLDARTTPWAFPIDPELPLSQGDHFAAVGLPGAFRDMTPDRWGQVLMDRREAQEAKDQGRPRRTLHRWDYLLGVEDITRMGAFRLRDPGSGLFLDDRSQTVPPVTRLRELEGIVAALARDDAEQLPGYRQWLELLLLPGSALGGARPKAVFAEDDGSMWLGKFPAHDDRYDVGAWEYLTHALASLAGIDVPPASRQRYSERGHTFMVRRFDRKDHSRRTYASAMTLLQRHHTPEEGSYLEIAEAIATLGDPASIDTDLEQLYRRALFSIFVANRDDHLRNHGFLRTAGGWRLSPAFDINPSPYKAEHVLAIDDKDPTPSSDLLRATGEFYFRKLRRNALARKIEQVEQEVRNAVARWPSVAAQQRLPASDCEQLATIIDTGR